MEKFFRVKNSGIRTAFFAQTVDHPIQPFAFIKLFEKMCKLSLLSKKLLSLGQIYGTGISKKS